MFKCKIVQPIQLPEPYSEYTRREATVAGSKSVKSHLRFKSMSFKVQSQSKVIFSKLGSPIRLQIIRTCLFILLSASPSWGPQTSFTPFLLILIGSQILIYRSDSNCHTETFLFKAGAQSTKTVQCQANFAR